MHTTPNKLGTAGFSTLPIILILMFMITALILYTSMVSLTEQKISANASRAAEAMHIAESGLERTIERVKNAAFRQNNALFQPNTAGSGCLNGGTVIANPANTVPPQICSPSTTANNIFYDSVPAGTPVNNNPVFSFGATIMNFIPNNFDEIVIESVGCTDACDCSQGGTGTRKDCPVRKILRQSVVFVRPATTPPPMPSVNIAGANAQPTPPTLNVLNDAVLSGSVVIDSSTPPAAGNPDNRSEFAMLAGGTITFNDASPSFTNHRGIDTTESPTETAAGSGIFKLGVNQVVVNSATQWNKGGSSTADDFLLRFLGSNFAANHGNQATNVLKTIKSLGTAVDCISKACTDNDLTAAIATSPVIVVEGNLPLTVAKIWGTAKPLLLIVIGDLQIQANTTINGMVYVRPTADTIWTTPAVGGNLTVNGRLVVEGSLTSTGNLTITNNAGIDTALGQITFAERIPATWEEL